MAIFIKRVTRTAIVATAAAAIGVCVMSPAASFASSLSDRVDNLANSVDDMESKVQSTLLSGGSSPVSFAGEARLKVQYHDLGFDAPGYMTADRSYLQSGWEGNENLYRLGMVVHPGRNLVLWSKIGFQHTLTGPGSKAVSPNDEGFVEYPYRHDKVRNSVTIHEDMCAGIAVRTVPASFWVKMGNTLWTEASPLTVWKSQPRTFAWEYLPFEVEQPIARYYEYNIAKGEKAGRAAWNKKPFNGINVESINLPWELYTNFVYGAFERYDNFEREFIDFANDLGYADGLSAGTFPEKGHGIGDSYRHVIHGRLAKGKTFGDMTLGLNYVGIDYKEKDALFASKNDAGTPVYLFLREFKGYDSIFFKEPKTVSVDLRGPISGPFSMHTDVAVNWTDTVWMIDSEHADATYSSRAGNPAWYNRREVSTSDIVPAFYSKLTYDGLFKLDADLAWISPGFYSPFSFAAPADAFYAFGANMVGAGKFIARGEGSPYTQNMAGVNLTYTPKLPGYGHLRVKYGQHWNITEDGRDLLFFPHRLNGSDAFSFFHSSYNRWGNGLIDNSVKGPSGDGLKKYYKGRLGDESFYMTSSWNGNYGGRQVAGPDAGGLRTDYMSMLEGFVAYGSAEEAYRNWRAGRILNSDGSFVAIDNPSSPSLDDLSANPNNILGNYSTINNRSHFAYETVSRTEIIDDVEIVVVDTVGTLTTNTSWVPTSKKYTFNLELDAAYDIGKSIGYKKDLFVGGYAGISGITRGGISPLAFDEKDANTLLWSFYTRLEPAIALHKNFYVLGLFGFENWRSDKSWMMVDRAANDSITGIRNPTVGLSRAQVKNFVQVPIDFRDFAYGVGFDWDVLERVGLHGRFKVIQHIDQGLNDKYKEWGINAKPEDKNDWITPVVSLEIKTWF